MPETRTTDPSLPLKMSTVGQPFCEHRFDVVCVEGQFVLDLWECRYCGQRIRRKKVASGRLPDV